VVALTAVVALVGLSGLVAAARSDLTGQLLKEPGAAAEHEGRK
jgi:hypothetical protein